MYLPSEHQPKLKRVTGIGGFFFRAKDSKGLTAWYNKHLGLDTNDYGCTFHWKDADGNDCTTQWSAFSETTTYMEPSHKQFMQNFRVHDLDALLERLKSEGVEIVGEPQAFDYGKFGWILDPEGNKIELWEPIDKAFL
ncbi:MAG: VOC family protein [Flavobacterium sp.]|nr:MAG: VOC family protein [Flavobacterium sp.]